MFCTNCGTQIEENAAICPVCGAAVAAQQNEAAQEVQTEVAEQPVYVEAEAPAHGKGFAITSLVLGIVSFLCLPIITGTLAIIFGAIALAKNHDGKGMAKAGLICGIIGVAAWIIMLASGLTTAITSFNMY